MTQATETRTSPANLPAMAEAAPSRDAGDPALMHLDQKEGRGTGRLLLMEAVPGYLPTVWLLVLLILLWYGAVSLFHLPFYILPTPAEVLNALVSRGWNYLPDVATTLQEILAGFGLGLVAAVPLAVLISVSWVVRRAVYPVVIASKMIPIFALAAIVTIMFAYGLLPEIVVTALYSFFPIVVTGADGLMSVDADHVNLLRGAGASRWQIMLRLRLPWSLPAFFSGAKLGIVFAVSGAAIGEWIGGQSGLGYLMRFQDSALDVPGMFATVVVLSLLGVVLFAAVSLLEYMLLPWNRAKRTDLGGLWRAR